MSDLDYVKKRNRLRAEKVIDALRSRNMYGIYAEDRGEALGIALNMIPKGSSVSWGGTISIEQIGLKEALSSPEYTVYNRDSLTDPEERREMEIAAFTSDFFLASCNAVTEDGIIVNMDGMANRVANIAYGPKKVIMVVGVNKITRDIDTAVSRVRNESAPLNASRLGIDTPCVKTGACFDCKSPATICCQMLITRYSKIKDRIVLILVNDEIGL